MTIVPDDGACTKRISAPIPPDDTGKPDVTPAERISTLADTLQRVTLGVTSLQAATLYRQAGLQVIPVPLGEKGATLPDWPNRRFGEDELPQFFSVPCNVGIVLGDGLIDVDLDCPEAVELAPSFLPKTGMIHGRESKRRSHYWYRPSGPTSPKKFCEKDGDCLVELRTGSQLTLVPQSTHPNGEEYTWDETGEPGEVEVAELIRSVERLASAVLLLRRYPTEGSRQDFFLALSGTLARNTNLSEEEAKHFLEALSEAAEDEESAKRIKTLDCTLSRIAAGKSATGWPKLQEFLGGDATKLEQWLHIGKHSIADIANGGDWDEPIPFNRIAVPPFPTDALPDFLQRYAEAEAEAVQVPTDLPGILLLSVLSVCCGKHVEVIVREDWTEPVNLYCAVAMQSGERKTPVFNHLTEPLVKYEKHLRDIWQPQITEAQAKYDLLKAKREKAKQDALRGEASDDLVIKLAQELDCFRVQALPRLLADDCTPEQLATLLHEQDGRLAILSDEGGVFKQMAGQYTKLPNLEIYLKAWSGSRHQVDRRGRAEDTENPILTLGLAVQPAVIAGIMRNPALRDVGLPARFLYAVPDSLVGHRSSRTQPVPWELRAEYDETIAGLLKVLSAKPGTPAVVHRLRLTPEALECLLGFADWLEPHLGEYGELDGLTDWGNKLGGQVARIAGLLHMVEYVGHFDPEQYPIELATVEQAVRIGKYLIPHAKKAFGIMGADAREEAAKVLLHAIERRGVTSFTERELFEWVKGQTRFPSMAEVRNGLAQLVEYNYVRQDKPAARVGRPTVAYSVSPRLAFAKSTKLSDVLGEDVA